MFYTKEEWDSWTDRKGWDVDYKKGLASLDNKDISKDMEDPRYSIFKVDRYAHENITKFFHPSMSDERKEAISSYIPQDETIEENMASEIP